MLRRTTAWWVKKSKDTNISLPDITAHTASLKHISQSKVGHVHWNHRGSCVTSFWQNTSFVQDFLPPSQELMMAYFLHLLITSHIDVTINSSPRGSSKRVSSSTRCSVGSLVPQISLSDMITWESSVSHSPGPSCENREETKLHHHRQHFRPFTQLWWRWLVIKPRLIGGCYAGESRPCRPSCPRLTLCSTPRLLDPGPDG